MNNARLGLQKGNMKLHNKGFPKLVSKIWTSELLSVEVIDFLRNIPILHPSVTNLWMWLTDNHLLDIASWDNVFIIAGPYGPFIALPLWLPPQSVSLLQSPFPLLDSLVLRENDEAVLIFSTLSYPTSHVPGRVVMLTILTTSLSLKERPEDESDSGCFQRAPVILTTFTCWPAFDFEGLLSRKYLYQRPSRKHSINAELRLSYEANDVIQPECHKTKKQSKQSTCIPSGFPANLISQQRSRLMFQTMLVKSGSSYSMSLFPFNPGCQPQLRSCQLS